MINISKFIQKTYELQQQALDQSQKKKPPVFQLAFNCLEKPNEQLKISPRQLGTQFTFRSEQGMTQVPYQPLQEQTFQENRDSSYEIRHISNNENNQNNAQFLNQNQFFNKQNELKQDCNSKISYNYVQGASVLQPGQPGFSLGDYMFEKLKSRYEEGTESQNYEEQTSKNNNYLSANEPQVNSINNRYHNSTNNFILEQQMNEDMKNKIQIKALPSNTRYQTLESNFSISDNGDEDIVLQENINNNQGDIIHLHNFKAEGNLNQFSQDNGPFSKNIPTLSQKKQSLSAIDSSQEYGKMNITQQDSQIQNQYYGGIQSTPNIHPIIDLKALLTAEPRNDKLKDAIINKQFNDQYTSECQFSKHSMIEQRQEEIKDSTNSKEDNLSNRLQRQFTNILQPKSNMGEQKIEVDSFYHKSHYIAGGTPTRAGAFKINLDLNQSCEGSNQVVSSMSMNNLRNNSSNKVSSSSQISNCIIQDSLASTADQSTSRFKFETLSKILSPSSDEIKASYRQDEDEIYQAYNNNNNNNNNNNRAPQFEFLKENLPQQNTYLQQVSCKLEDRSAPLNQQPNYSKFNHLQISIHNNTSSKSPIRSNCKRDNSKDNLLPNNNNISTSKQIERQIPLNWQFGSPVSPSPFCNNALNNLNSENSTKDGNSNNTPKLFRRLRSPSSTSGNYFNLSGDNASPLNKIRQDCRKYSPIEKENDKSYLNQPTQFEQYKYTSLIQSNGSNSTTPKGRVKSSENNNTREQSGSKNQMIINPQNYNKPPWKSALDRTTSSSQNLKSRLPQINIEQQHTQPLYPPAGLTPQQKFYKSNQIRDNNVNDISVLAETLQTERKQIQSARSNSSSSTSNPSQITQIKCIHGITQLYCSHCCRKSRSQIENQLRRLQ